MSLLISTRENDHNFTNHLLIFKTCDYSKNARSTYFLTLWFYWERGTAERTCVYKARQLLSLLYFVANSIAFAYVEANFWEMCLNSCGVYIANLVLCFVSLIASLFYLELSSVMQSFCVQSIGVGLKKQDLFRELTSVSYNGEIFRSCGSRRAKEKADPFVNH